MKKGELYLYGTIGLDPGCKALDVVRALAEMAADGCTDCDMRINSPGGSISDGTAMIAAMDASPMNITTINDGLAASMASLVLLAGDTVRMCKGALLMIHNPKMDDNGSAEDKIKAAALLEKMADSAAERYATKTGLPKEQIKAMMDDETWLTADEALLMKFIDAIHEDGQGRMEMARMNSVEDIYRHYSKQLIKQDKDMVFDKTLLESLGLPEDATAEMVTNATIALAKKMADNEKAARETAATLLVEGAVAGGKITAEQKAAYMALATNDYANTKTALDSMPARISMSEALANATRTAAADDRSNWTAKMWEKQDPKGFYKMSQEKPEHWKALMDASYGEFAQYNLDKRRDGKKAVAGI